MVGENVDLTSDPAPPSEDPPGGKRRYIGISFACCDIYSRIYVNRQQTAYEGNCPRCARQVNLQIGPGGTDQRFFTAY